MNFQYADGWFGLWKINFQKMSAGICWTSAEVAEMFSKIRSISVMIQCNPSISVKFRGKRKTFYGEMLKNLTRFNQKSKRSKKTSEMLQSNYENVLNSWNVSRYLWRAWKCWKWTISRKMSLWWSRQRAVWSWNLDGFQPFVAFCDFDGVMMNRSSFIMRRTSQRTRWRSCMSRPRKRACAGSLAQCLPGGATGAPSTSSLHWPRTWRSASQRQSGCPGSSFGQCRRSLNSMRSRSSSPQNASRGDATADGTGCDEIAAMQRILSFFLWNKSLNEGERRGGGYICQPPT